MQIIKIQFNLIAKNPKEEEQETDRGRTSVRTKKTEEAIESQIWENKRVIVLI